MSTPQQPCQFSTLSPALCHPVLTTIFSAGSLEKQLTIVERKDVAHACGEVRATCACVALCVCACCIVRLRMLQCTCARVCTCLLLHTAINGVCMVPSSSASHDRAKMINSLLSQRRYYHGMLGFALEQNGRYVHPQFTLPLSLTLHYRHHLCHRQTQTTDPITDWAHLTAPHHTLETIVCIGL